MSRKSTNDLTVVRGVLARAAAHSGLGTPVPGAPLARVVKVEDMDLIRTKASELAKQSARKRKKSESPPRDRSWCSDEAYAAARSFFTSHPDTTNRRAGKHVRRLGITISNEAVARVRREVGLPPAKNGRPFSAKTRRKMQRLRSKVEILPSPAVSDEARAATDALSLEAMLPRLSIDMLRLCVQEWNRRVTAALDLATEPTTPLPEATTQG